MEVNWRSVTDEESCKEALEAALLSADRMKCFLFAWIDIEGTAHLVERGDPTIYEALGMVELLRQTVIERDMQLEDEAV